MTDYETKNNQERIRLKEILSGSYTEQEKQEAQKSLQEIEERLRERAKNRKPGW